MTWHDRAQNWEEMEAAQAPYYIPPPEELARLPDIIQEQYKTRKTPTVSTQNQAYTDYIEANQEAYTQITQPPSNERSHDQYMMDTQNELELGAEQAQNSLYDHENLQISAQAEPGVFDPRSWAPKFVDYLFGDKLSFSDVPIGEGHEAQVAFEDALVDQWVSDVLDVAKYTGGLTGAVAGIVGDFRNTTGSWSDYFGGTGDLTTALASSAGTIQRAGDILLPPPEYATDAVDKIIYDQEGNELSAEEYRSSQGGVRGPSYDKRKLRYNYGKVQPQNRTWNEFLYNTSRLDLEGLDYDVDTDQVFRTQGSREGEVIDTTDQEVMKEFAKSANVYASHAKELPKIRLDDNNKPMTDIHIEPGYKGYAKEYRNYIEARVNGKLIAVAQIQHLDPKEGEEKASLIIHTLGSNPAEGGLVVGRSIWAIGKMIESERFLGRPLNSEDIEMISSISPDAARMIHKYFTKLAQKAGEPHLGEWKGNTWTPK